MRPGVFKKLMMADMLLLIVQNLTMLLKLQQLRL